ncbi:MAG: glycoside hydrolase family 28 protein [Rikenellaceae bacterium]|nr:glycoside hydrolase family 28 protein [Rikenellaceae bacterium]
MRKIYILFILSVCAVCLNAQDASHAWNKIYPEIEKNISAPVFRDAEYRITDFNAIPNNPDQLNHMAINTAINTCSEEGGGKVVIPAGTWHTGGIVLKSNVNLHLENGAILLFTTDPQFFPSVLTRWEGLDCYNTQPLIYAYGETNVAITGKGVIDGGASHENWWPKCGAAKFGWEEGMISQRTGRPKLLRWSEDNVPIEQRVLTIEDGMRPQLINLYKCENVLVEEVTLLRSPFWVLHPLMCENVIIRGVTFENDGPNGDGCDPESCKNVLIEDCYFDTGDDCIAIKSGRNNDGRRWNMPSENIIVRNCMMKNGHGGVVIGSEISGGYKNLFVENCKMDSPLLDRVIRIKTNTCRGGIVENIYVRNIEVGECKEAVLKINLVYESKEDCNRAYPPTVRNVYLENITSGKSKYGVLITALEDEANVYNINVSNCVFDGVSETAYPLRVEGQTKNINFTNLRINGHDSMLVIK